MPNADLEHQQYVPIYPRWAKQHTNNNEPAIDILSLVSTTHDLWYLPIRVDFRTISLCQDSEHTYSFPSTLIRALTQKYRSSRLFIIFDSCVAWCIYIVLFFLHLMKGPPLRLFSWKIDPPLSQASDWTSNDGGNLSLGSRIRRPSCLSTIGRSIHLHHQSWRWRWWPRSFSWESWLWRVQRGSEPTTINPQCPLLFTRSLCHPQKLSWADRYWTDDNIWDLLGGLRAVINGGVILALDACFWPFQRQPRWRGLFGVAWRTVSGSATSTLYKRATEAAADLGIMVAIDWWAPST